MNNLEQVMADSQLTLQAKAIYYYLLHQAGGRIRFPMKSPKDIQYELNIGPSMYYAHLNKLISRGYLRIEKVRNEKHRFSGSECILTERMGRNEQVSKRREK